MRRPTPRHAAAGALCVGSLACALTLGVAACGLLWGALLVVAMLARIPFLRSQSPAVRTIALLFALSNALWLVSDVWRVMGAPPEAGTVAIGPEILADLGIAIFVAVIVGAVYQRGRPRMETWMDSVSFVAALAPGFWLALIAPAASEPALSPWVWAWAGLTLLLLFAGGLFVMSGGIWNVPSVLLAAGVVGNVTTAVVVRALDPVGAAAVPLFAVGYLLGAWVCLHPGLPQVFVRGGRPGGIPLDLRVWMLVGALVLPLSVLGWSYVRGDSAPIALIAGSVAVIAIVVAIRALLLRRAGIQNWSVPLTISVTALLIAVTAVSMSSLSQSAQRAQRAVDRLSAMQPDVNRLDGLLLRSARDGDDAAASRSDWAATVRRLRSGDASLRPELDRYVAAASPVLLAMDPRSAPQPGDRVDGAAMQAQQALSVKLASDLARRQSAALERAKRVRLFSVAMLFVTLIAVAGLLLRFNASRRRIDLQYQATHDDLTGLPNRAALDRELDKSGPADSGAGGRALVVFDLDDFKTINDALGRRAGDDLLTTIARRLEDALRSDHMLVRLEGDAFAVLVPSGAESLVAAQRVLAALAAPVELGDRSQVVYGSVGVADIDESDPDRGASAFRDAELAMYQAKLVTGNSIERFADDLHGRVRARIQLAADLRAALDDDHLHLVYQPIVDLLTGQISGYEALIRWNHPTQGPLSPADFIPIAEQSGLIVDIGGWVLRAATAQLAGWQREWSDERYVSVNVAAAQLTTNALAGQVETALRESGLAPGRLLLEVTESSIIEDVDGSIEQMERVRAAGVRFALDDFGTGYSSLSYLRRFPVDVLKVDKSFVDALDDPDGYLLVRAIVDMATSLRLRVVAEGIEHPEQAAALQQFGCGLGQGYHFSRPVPPLDVQAGPGQFTVPVVSRLRALP